MDVANNNSCNRNHRVWRTMMEEIYRCQHLFTENDLDVVIGTMRWMECRSQWLMCHGRVGDTFTKPEKDSTEGTIFEELDLPFSGKEGCNA